MTDTLKVWLIQDVVAPYRIKLFDKIAQTSQIDFRLIILSPKSRIHPQWIYSPETLPFSAELVEGWHFYTGPAKRYSFNPRLFLRLMSERPDVVICAGYSFATVQTFFYALVTGRKYVLWMEGTGTTEQTRSLRLLRHWQRKLLTRSASALIDAGTESNAYLRTLLPMDRHPTFFRSFNAVDNDYIAETATRFRADGKAFADFKSRFASKNILFVGQLVERKGITQLLTAYCRVIQLREEPVGLIMLGTGLLRDEIQAIREKEGLEHLYLEGFIEQDVYPKYLAVADVLVLPSLSDPNPLVVFEALAAGKPIVLSERAGNAADFVDEGKNGYVVNPLNTDDMADKLCAVLDLPPDDIKAMGEHSRQLVRKANYSDSAKGFIDAARHAAKRMDQSA